MSPTSKDLCPHQTPHAIWQARRPRNTRGELPGHLNSGLGIQNLLPFPRKSSALLSSAFSRKKGKLRLGVDWSGGKAGQRQPLLAGCHG